ncbi:MAG TPA: uracil-DNA glycosylase [Kofleriaceae bacterium]|nr:uracil-DNA glycosylase [Kofleriaceae bacterium]
MDSTDDLARLARDLRSAIGRHARAGAFGAPGGATARASLPVVTAVEAPVVSIEDAPAPRTRLTLAEVRAELGDCKRCKLHSTRTKLVFGVGAEDAPLMFVGEAPGADEDRLGEPFVGRAGELLDKMIEAMGWTRETVYIANILKSRPPGNRNPEPDEVAACFPFLERQIEAIAPRVIVALGRPASNGLLANTAPISALRGRFHDRRGVRVMPTFHPAFLLRTPERKRDAWSDLKLVMAELDRLGIAAPRPRSA